jgi:signal transduction histidine kinase
MTDRSDEHASHWWESFYWRVGVSFVVFVIGVVMAQSIIFMNRIERLSEETPWRSPNNISLAVAAQLGDALQNGRVGDLNTFLMERFPRERSVYVLMRDGRLASTSPEPLRDSIRAAAEASLIGTSPRHPDELPRLRGPVVLAPVQAFGELRGVVIIPPPGRRGVIRDAARFFSLRGVVILIAATIAASLVIFGPARRRVVSLEMAAVRLGRGDLSARGEEAGRDEISRLARAFNRMGSELADRDKQLRASERLRRQLLADVSHELKTPLTAMRGFLETIQMGDAQLSAEQRGRYLETVIGETVRLERIVADLIELARFENNVVALDPRVFAAERLFEHVLRRHEREILARCVQFEVEVSAAADQMYGDPHRLEQVVENLVANALRYVPDGGTIGLYASADGSTTVLRVTDSGPGIAPEDVAHVFDRFYKTDPARLAEGAGSGLGLAIVKAIVERHGGAVDLRSCPGHTEFTMTLPHAVADEDSVNLDEARAYTR